MHFVFYLRGINSEVEKWKTLAQGLFWKWQRINQKTGKVEEVLVQGALRPSIMGTWEYVFPKEALHEVLAIMGLTTKKQIGIDWALKNRLRLLGLRKLLGVKQIPLKEFKKAAKVPPSITIKESWRGLSHLMTKGVSIHPIGIKTDRFDVIYDPIEKKSYKQEML